MTLKKFAKVVLSCLMAGALFTGCGGNSDTKDPNSQATIIKVGMITHLNASEKQMEEYLFKIQEKARAKIVNHIPKFYDSLNLMQLGIESGEVDEISTYKSVADYIIANNANFELVADNTITGLADNFCFVVRKEDTQLKAELDKAIEEMKADGSLNKLVENYITNVDKQNPPKVEIPMLEGADTIKVGVTGDLPPLDLVLADNSPAGFNTALLAEVAKRSGKNIELIQVDSGARAVALTSKQIDVIFWAILPLDYNAPADIDKPDGAELSVPYFKDNIVHLKLKN